MERRIELGAALRGLAVVYCSKTHHEWAVLSMLSLWDENSRVNHLGHFFEDLDTRLE